MANLKDLKTLYKMSPEDARTELMSMKADPILFSAYLDKYGPHGHLHEAVVLAVTVLFDRSYGEPDGFHPDLDQQYDATTGEPDDEATRRVYEAHVIGIQSKKLRAQGITPPDVSEIVAKDGTGPMGRFEPRKAKGDKGEKPRSLAELKADPKFTKALFDKHGDRGTDPDTHAAAVAEWHAANEAEYGEAAA